MRTSASLTSAHSHAHNGHNRALSGATSSPGVTPKQATGLNNMNTHGHHHPTSTTTPTFAFDEQVAMEAEEIREELQRESEEYRRNPAYTPVLCDEEREECHLAWEEFSHRSIFRFILNMLSDEYSVAGIVAAGIPGWMVHQAARTAIMALDLAILNKAGPKDERSVAKSPRRSRRPARRSTLPRRH